MPVLSVLAYKIRVAVSGAVGALIFIIPAHRVMRGHWVAPALTITRPRRSGRPPAPAWSAARACSRSPARQAGRASPAATIRPPGGRSSRWSPPSLTAAGRAALPWCCRRARRRSRMPRSTALPAAARGTVWRSATTSTAGRGTCRRSSRRRPMGDGPGRSRHARRPTPPPPRRRNSSRSPAPATGPAPRSAATRTPQATRRPWCWPSPRPGHGGRPPRSRPRRTRPPTRTPS